jgi:hypothetical protein
LFPRISTCPYDAPLGNALGKRFSLGFNVKVCKPYCR